MKNNLKVNALWLALILFGYLLMTVLASTGILNPFYLQIFEQIGINIILAVGLNLIVGFSGPACWYSDPALKGRLFGDCDPWCF